MALIQSELPALQLLSRGKVRDVYAVDDDSLLFVATDRLSAFDVVMKNVRAVSQRRHCGCTAMLTTAGPARLVMRVACRACPARARS